MTTILQIGEQAITCKEIIPLLASYQLMPRLLFELIIDNAICQWEKSLALPKIYTQEEIEKAHQEFYQKNQISEEKELLLWLERNYLTAEQLHDIILRNLRIEEFKQASWGNKIESYFLQRKSTFDKVIYSLIQTQEIAAQELYFRIKEGEAEFSEIARKYSQNSQAENGGLIGPIELVNCHPTIAKMLSISQPGQIFPPTRIGEWLVIVRLEKFIPAQLDNFMRQRLIGELFAAWLQDEFNRLNIKYDRSIDLLMTNS